MAETAILVRTFDEAWDISDSDARYTTVRCHCPELRLHRRECVFCNLGLRATNGSQQRTLPCVWEADKTDVSHRLKLEYHGQLLAFGTQVARAG